jgi:hypothetical protein
LLKFTSFYAQEFHLENISKIDTNNTVLKSIISQKIHQSKKSVLSEIDSVLIKLEYKGYLNATLDTIFVNDSLYKAQYIIGQQTESLKIYYQNLPLDIISKNKLQQTSKALMDG